MFNKIPFEVSVPTEKLDMKFRTRYKKPPAFSPSNEKAYRIYSEAKYLTSLIALTDRMSQEACLPRPLTVCIEYLLQQKNRFIQSLEVLETIGEELEEKEVLDLGSTIPYCSYWLKLRYNCNIDLKSNSPRKDFDIEGMKFRYFDLLEDSLEKEYSLIIFEEVIEHLPCSLFPIVEEIMTHIEPEGYLLFSTPIGHKETRRDSLDAIITRLPDRGHYRTLKKEDTETLFGSLELIFRDIVYTTAQGHILELWKKEGIDAEVEQIESER